MEILVNLGWVSAIFAVLIALIAIGMFFMSLLNYLMDSMNEPSRDRMRKSELKRQGEE